MQARTLRIPRAVATGQAGLLVVVALLIALFAVGASVSDRFTTTGNILNVYEQSTGLALVSLGQTLTVLTGGIDLSVGSVISLLSMLTSGLIDGDPALVAPVLAGVLLLGILIGAANGLAIVFTGVHPLIVTLGSGAILQGIALLYGLGPVSSVPLEFDVFAYGTIFDTISIGATVALALFLLVSFFLNNTRTGRRGTVVQVGLHTKKATIDAMLWALKDITLEATWCYPTDVWPRVADMIASGRFPVEKIVTATIRPEDVVEKGFEALLDPSGRNMKVLVEMRTAA